MLIPSPRQLISKMTILKPRCSFRIVFLYFSIFSFLWQFATIYNVPLFFCLMKIYQFLLHESLFSLQYLSMVGVVIILLSDET